MSRADYLNALLNQRKQKLANGNVLVDPSIGQAATLDTSFTKPTNISKPDLNANPLKSSVKTGQEFVSNVTEGVAGFLDSIGDIFLQIGGSISGGVSALTGGSFEQGFEWAKQAMTYDWESQFTNAINQTIGFLPGVLTGETFSKDYWQNWADVGSAEESRKNINELHQQSYTSLLGENGQNIYNSITQGIGNVLPSIVLGIATGGASIGAQMAIGAASGFAQGYGAQMEQAIKEGANVGQATLSGLVGGAVEAGTEMLFMGIGKGINAARKGISKITGQAVKETATTFGQHILGRNIAKPFAKMTFKEIATSAVEEGTEEFLTELFTPLAESVYKGEEALKAYEFGTPEWFDLIGQASVSFAGGAVGGLFGTGVNSAITTKTFTKQGKEVVNQVAELKTLQQDVINEAMKSNPNQELLGKAEEKLGQAYKNITDSLNGLKTSNKKAYDNVVKLLANPKQAMQLLEDNTTGVDSIEFARQILDKDIGRNTSQLVIDDINNTLRNNNVNANVKVGNVREGKAIYTTKDGNIVIDSKHLKEVGALIRHEVFSHVVLDSDVQTRENLIKHIENSDSLKKEFHKYDKELKAKYPAKDISRERLAFFLENVLSDKKKFDKVFKGNVFTRLLNKIKARFGNIDSRVLGDLQTALGKGQTSLEQESYAKELENTYGFIRFSDNTKVYVSNFETALDVISETASEYEEHMATIKRDGDEITYLKKKYVDKLNSQCAKVLSFLENEIYDLSDTYDAEIEFNEENIKKVQTIFDSVLLDQLESVKSAVEDESDYSYSEEPDISDIDSMIEYASEIEEKYAEYLEDKEEYIKRESKKETAKPVETKTNAGVNLREELEKGKKVKGSMFGSKTTMSYNKNDRTWNVLFDDLKYQKQFNDFGEFNAFINDTNNQTKTIEEFANENKIPLPKQEKVETKPQEQKAEETKATKKATPKKQNFSVDQIKQLLESGKKIEVKLFGVKTVLTYNKEQKTWDLTVPVSTDSNNTYTKSFKYYDELYKFATDEGNKKLKLVDFIKQEQTEPAKQGFNVQLLDERNVYTFRSGKKTIRVESLKTYNEKSNAILFDTDAWSVIVLKDKNDVAKKKTLNSRQELAEYLSNFKDLKFVNSALRKETKNLNTLKETKTKEKQTPKKETSKEWKPKKGQEPGVKVLGLENVVGDNNGGKNFVSKLREDNKVKALTANQIKRASIDDAINLKSSDEILDFTLDFVSQALGQDIRFENFKEYKRQVFENYNLSNAKEQKALFNKIAHDILNADVSITIDHSDGTKGVYDITVGEILDYKGYHADDYANKLQQALEMSFAEKSEPSQRKKELLKLWDMFEKVSQDFARFRATAKQNFELGVQIRKAKEEIKALSTRGMPSGEVRIDKEVDFLMTLLSNRWVTRTGKVSGMIRQKAFELTQTKHTYIDKNTGQETTGDTLDMIQNSQEISTLIPDVVFTFYREIAKTYNPKVKRQKTLGYGEVYILNYSLKSLRKVVDEFKEGKYQDMQEKQQATYTKVEFANESLGTSPFKNKVMGLLEKFTSPITNMKVAVSGINLANNVLVEQPIQAYSKKRLEQAKLERSLEKIIKKSTIQKNANQKVEWKTDNGKTIKMEKYNIYGLYMNMQCEYNKANILTRGYEIILNDGTHYIIRNNENLEEQIAKHLSKEEIAELEKLSELLNGEIKEYAKKSQKKVDHFSTMLDERYYPNTISDGNNPTYVDKKLGASFIVDASNTGFLKSRSGNRNALRIVNPISLITSYIDSVTTYGEISQTQKIVERFINKKMDGDRNILQVLNETNPGFTKQYISYIKKLIGSPVTQKEEGIMSSLAGKYATAVLGYNIGTMLTQTASLPTAMSLTGIRSGAKALVLSKKFGEQGIKETYKWLLENNGIFSYRVLNHGFIKGETGSNKFNQYASKVLNKVSEFGLKGMEAVDTLMCVLSFKMAQQTVQDTKGYKIGTQENYNEANKLFNHIILETQSNSDAIAKSMLRSGEMGNMMKYTFGMFASDAQNKLSLLYENVVNGYRNKRMYNLAKKMLDENSFGKYTKQEVQEIYNETKGKLNFYNKSIGRYFALLLASGAAAELAKILRDLFYGRDLKKDPEEWIWEFANETLVEWLPMVGAFVNSINYGSINAMPLQAVYNLGTSVTELITALKEGNNASGKITNLLFSISEMLGISAKNIKNIIVGVTNMFNGAKALELNNMLYGYSLNYLSQQFNETKDTKYLSLLMQEYKVECDETVINEIAKLKEAGYNCVPQNYLTEYNDQPLSSYDIAMFKEYYKLSNSQVRELLSLTDYRSKTQEKQAKMIKYIFDAFHDYAKYKVLGVVPTSRMAKLLVENNGNINLAKLIPIYLEASEITENATATRKEQVINFLNRNRSLTKKEKETILSLLGYKLK